jgi:hypothetical protein
MYVVLIAIIASLSNYQNSPTVENNEVMGTVERCYNQKLRYILASLAYYTNSLDKAYELNDSMILKRIKSLVFPWRTREKDAIIKQAIYNIQRNVEGINKALLELGFKETLNVDCSTYEVYLRKRYLNK